MPKKQILCLASSAKGGDLCVAGLDMDSGRWVRPVRQDTHEWKLPSEQCRCREYGSIRKFDVIEINTIATCHKAYHPEDVEVDGTVFRVVDRGLNQDKLEMMQRALANPESLFGFDGKSKPIEEIEQNPLVKSLELINPNNTARYYVETYERKKHRVSFRCGVEFYQKISITDQAYFPIMDPRDDGIYKQNDVFPEAESVFFLVSVTEPHNGFCYLVIPSIIELKA